MLKFTIAVTGIILSLSSQASTVSFNGYTLDTNNNIVTGGGLRWLQWDETVGLSVNEALANNNDWRVATDSEMNALMSDFGLTFGEIYQSNQDSSNITAFIDLFGETSPGEIPSFDRDSSAIYQGTETDIYSALTVGSNYLENNPYPLGSSSLNGLQNFIYSQESFSVFGVALVSPVPVPAAAWLFSSALVGLAGVKRKS